MNPLRRSAFSAYYYATMPYRSATLKKQAAQGNAPISVLFYHRVADTHPNGWTITRDGFAQQMEWLQNNSDLISIEEVQRRMVEGNPRRATCITFDDGYAENCAFAIPLLVEAGIPVTYFVSLEPIKTGCAFPHDKELGQPLEVNTIDQLRAMVDAGVEIGAHTSTHPDMGKVTDQDVLRAEVVDATLELGDLVGQPIRYFAFPFGQESNLNAEAARLAADEAGIQAVCSAFGAYNLPGNDPFHIRRVHGDPEFTRWRNWVSVDQRLLNARQQIGCELETQRCDRRAIADRRNDRSERRDTSTRRRRQLTGACQ